MSRACVRWVVWLAVARCLSQCRRPRRSRQSAVRTPRAGACLSISRLWFIVQGGGHASVISSVSLPHSRTTSRAQRLQPHFIYMVLGNICIHLITSQVLDRARIHRLHTCAMRQLNLGPDHRWKCLRTSGGNYFHPEYISSSDWILSWLRWKLF